MLKKLFSLGLMLFLVSGCFGGGSTETLRCSLVEEEYDMKTEVDYELNFKDGNPSTANLDMSMDFGDEEMAEMNYEFMDEMFLEMFDGEGVSSSTNLRGSVITISINMDFDKIADHAVAEEILGTNFDDTVTMEEIKADLEGSGFVCR